MAKQLWFISYKLVEGSSVDSFLAASKKVNDEILSKQQGFISWKVLLNGDTWVDLITWETEEDALRGETAGQTNPIALDFYAFIQPESCVEQRFSLAVEY